MSIILATHPRSGSTKIIKCIARHFANKNLNVKNLGEFFYLRNSYNYGDLKFYNESKSNYKTYKIENGILNEHTINDRSILEEFLMEEKDRRMNYLKYLENNNNFFVLKYFFDNKVSSSFYEKTEEQLFSSDYDKIFLYRKNILDSILSLIIKDQFINLKNINLNNNEFNLIGHNYGNMEPLYPNKKIYLTQESCRSYSTMFINFFKYLKIKNNLNLLCYEDVFSQGYFYIDSEKITLNLDTEVKMVYGVDKKEFFSNIDEIKNYIKELIFQNDLLPLTNTLGITYD